jgi:hypothetical protein
MKYFQAMEKIDFEKEFIGSVKKIFMKYLKNGKKKMNI